MGLLFYYVCALSIDKRSWFIEKTNGFESNY